MIERKAVDWDKAKEGPVESDHLEGCNADENGECICAEIEADLGAFHEDRLYEQMKDRQIGAI